MYPTVRSRQGGRVRTVSSGYKTYTESIRSSWGNFLVSEAIFHAATPYLMSDLWQNIIFTYICIFKAFSSKPSPFDKEPNIYTLQLKYRHCQT